MYRGVIFAKNLSESKHFRAVIGAPDWYCTSYRHALNGGAHGIRCGPTLLIIGSEALELYERVQDELAPCFTQPPHITIIGATQ